ncbi:MAG: GNAT family N-acetyltransferase [Chloroflexota bacterium]
MIDDIPDITTPHLELVSMSLPFMEALAGHDMAGASAELDAEVSEWMADELENFLKFRLGQLRLDPTIRPWLGRSMVLTQGDGTKRAVGSIGFHGPPDEEGRLEVGYSVDPPFRRRGYATESVKALFDWAYREHGITRFVASISPGNEASLNLTAAYGFHQVGEHMDEIDGLEYVFETEWPRPASG